MPIYHKELLKTMKIQDTRSTVASENFKRFILTDPSVLVQ